MSTAEENIAVTERFWRAYNERRIEDAAELISADAHFQHFPHGIDLRGRSAIYERFKESLATLPDRHNVVVHMFAAGDHVVTETRFEGRTPGSTRPVTFDLCYIFRFEGGRVVEWREYG